MAEACSSMEEGVMDWKSEEGRALLWRAWPEGYLAGNNRVLTVGGWVKVPGGFGKPCWVAPSPLERNEWRGWPELVKGEDWPLWNAARQRGDLLPLPDERDPANWATLLGDLAKAINAKGEKWKVAYAPTNLVWYDQPGWGGAEWILATVMFHDDPDPVLTTIATFGPFDCSADEALVRARIQLREGVEDARS